MSTHVRFYEAATAAQHAEKRGARVLAHCCRFTCAACGLQRHVETRRHRQTCMGGMAMGPWGVSAAATHADAARATHAPRAASQHAPPALRMRSPSSTFLPNTPMMGAPMATSSEPRPSMILFLRARAAPQAARAGGWRAAAGMHASRGAQPARHVPVVLVVADVGIALDRLLHSLRGVVRGDVRASAGAGPAAAGRAHAAHAPAATGARLWTHARTHACNANPSLSAHLVHRCVGHCSSEGRFQHDVRPTPQHSTRVAAQRRPRGAHVCTRARRHHTHAAGQRDAAGRE
jgi:hypothetical protein